MPKRPCLACGTLIERGSYCGRHERLTAGTGKRGSTYRWRKLREQVLRRDGYRCVICGSVEQLQVDHVVAKSAGGADTLSNCRTLCRKCNLARGRGFSEC